MKAFIILFLSLSSFYVVAKPYEVGNIPFDLIGKDIDGSEIRISDFKGKVVIVSFWASWCGPCRKELPVLSGIQKNATTEKLQVISINIDENRKVFKKITEILTGTQMKLVSDAQHRIGKKYGVQGIPHMVIINADGKVAAVHIGYGESQLPELINQINEIWHNKPNS